MKKILPSIYKGKNNVNSKNQKQGIISEQKFQKDNNDEKNTKSIERQINDIFHSPNYVYKADVSITYNDGETIKKTIIGRTNNSLITLDDELIDVRKISKIDFLS